jgi:cobalamin biosynthesis Mg chelatase CobN
MKALRNGLWLGAAAVAILALPPLASAEPVVPPENSAATQYTEAIPTGGGQKDAGKSGNRGKRSPAQVLGSDKAQKLNEKGPEGKAAAEVAAETAPSVEPRPPSPASSEAPAAEPQPAASGDSGAKSNAKHRAGIAEHRKVQAAPSPAAEPDRSLSEEPAGSSGFGEVIAQATGSSSSGQLGALLPLLIVATIAWSLAYLWRQRQRAD